MARFGEQDLNEQSVQLFCFVTRLQRPKKSNESPTSPNTINSNNDAKYIDIDELVTPELMSRLSQVCTISVLLILFPNPNTKLTPKMVSV